MSVGRILCFALLAILAWVILEFWSSVGPETNATLSQVGPPSERDHATLAVNPVARPLREVISPRSEARPIFFRVQDESGARIVDARIQDEVSVLGLTDSEGLFALGTTEWNTDWKEVCVAAEGYASVVRVVERTDPEVVIQLRKPMKVTGLVVGEGGGPLGEPFDVVAWPRSAGRPSPEQVRAVLRKEVAGRILHAPTNLLGEFVLEGLAPGEIYSVIAGGGGMITREYATLYPDRPARMTLVVARVFGTRIRLVDESGNHVAFSGSLKARSTVIRGCDSSSADPMDVGELGALLAGIDVTSADAQGTIVSLYYSLGSVDSIPGCWIQIKAPGHEELHASLSANPAAQGLAERALVLRSKSNGRGSLQLLVKNAPEVLVNRLKAVPVVIRLEEPATHNVEKLFARLDLRSGAKLEDLATGDFEVQVQGVEGLWGTGKTAVTIGRETATLDCDLGACSAVQIRAMLPGGQQHVGFLALGVSPGTPTIEPDGRRRVTSGHVSTFEKGPYIVPVLASGEYTFRGMNPPWGWPSDESWLTVRLEPGELREIEVILEEPNR